MFHFPARSHFNTSVCLKYILLYIWMSDSWSHWMFKVNYSKSRRTFCTPCHSVSMRMCVRAVACVNKHPCLWSASAYPVKVLHAKPYSPLSPGGAVSPPAGLGFPCVDNDYLQPKNRGTQITVTRRGPSSHPHPSHTSLDPDEIWLRDLLRSAQP